MNHRTGKLYKDLSVSFFFPTFNKLTNRKKTIFYLLLLFPCNCDQVFFAADAVMILRHSSVSVWERVTEAIFFFLVSEWR